MRARLRIPTSGQSPKVSTDVLESDGGASGAPGNTFKYAICTRESKAGHGKVVGS
jgi:hypothetical protein